MAENTFHSEETSFGFQKVPTEDKERLVRGVFDSVATQYDLMNDLMSGGVHRIWKSVLIDRLNPQPGETLLDVAGGTGDIAHAFVKRADERSNSEKSTRSREAKAIICDINHEMLKAGILRPDRESFEGRIACVCGDAQSLPVPDKTVDSYTIAFGIRNVTKIDEALNDAYRTLKRGGRFVCLEFSHPITEGFQKLYDTYSFNAIPWLGEKVANDRESYQYLVESIRKFPHQDHFATMIKNAGFRRVKYENLTGGIAALHMGWKL